MRLRKNAASLTIPEKQAFVNAVLAMKELPSRLTPPTASLYDDYVQVHLGAGLHAHQGPAFLPWHREYLNRFELDLREIDPTVTVPYWDWTNTNPEDSIWTPEFMGGNGRIPDSRVMDGPFAFDLGNWKLTLVDLDLIYGDVHMGEHGHEADHDAHYFPDLKRQFGTNGIRLPTEQDVNDALQIVPFDRRPWDHRSNPSFRNFLEGFYGPSRIHNGVHGWVGGSMSIFSSPNDPVFWLHHANVDRIWAHWQALHPEQPYLPVTGGRPGHNLNDGMWPWFGDVTPASVLDHHAMGFYYESEDFTPPTCSDDLDEME